MGVTGDTSKTQSITEATKPQALIRDYVDIIQVAPMEDKGLASEKPPLLN